LSVLNPTIQNKNWKDYFIAVQKFRYNVDLCEI
jgi:hypothetical protein